jgi:hypothetical protein
VNFINAAIGSVGQSDRRSRVRFETVDKAEGKIERDQQGLPKAPEDFGAAICGGGSSPYLKVDQNALAEVSGEINDNAAEARDKKGQAAAALAEMDGKDQECFDKDIENLTDKRLKAQIEALQTNGCGAVSELCEKGRNGSLVDLADYAETVTSNDALGADLSALSGLSGLCNDNAALKDEMKKLEDEIADKRAELTGQPRPDRQDRQDRKIAEVTDPAKKAQEAELERKLAEKERELLTVNNRLAAIATEMEDAREDRNDAKSGFARPEIDRATNTQRKGKAEQDRQSLSAFLAMLMPCTNDQVPTDIQAKRTDLVNLGVSGSTCTALRAAIDAQIVERSNRIHDASVIEEKWNAYDQRRSELLSRRGDLSQKVQEETRLKTRKDDLDREIKSISAALGRTPQGDKLDPAVAVQIRQAIEKKEEELAKKQKQAASGGTGEQRSPGVAKCRSLAGDVRKTIDTLGRRAKDASDAGFAR